MAHIRILNLYERGRQVFHPNLVLARKAQIFHHILKFPYITGPAVMKQQVPHFI